MKGIREILPRGNEAIFASVLLILYGVEIFFSPDPRWTIWAAQMVMGILYVPDSPALQAMSPVDSVRAISVVGAFGCLTAAVHLALLRCENSFQKK